MLLRIIGWIIRQLIRWVGGGALLALILLLIALGSVTMGLAGALRGFDTTLMLLMVTLGLFTGWLLAKAPLPAWLAAPIAVALGSEIILLRVGQLGRPLGALFWRLIELAGAAWRWPLDGPPEPTPALEALAALGAGLNILLRRLFEWTMALLNGQPAYDLVATTLLWSMLLWLLAAWAAWAVRRYGQPLLALTPAGALLAVTLAYVPDQSGALVPLLGATLLLIALIRHLSREKRWQTSGVDFPYDLRLDMTMTILPLALTLMVIAWMAPSLSVRQIAKFAQRLMGGQVAQAQPMASSLGLEPRPAEVGALEKARAGGLPNRHLIGSGPDLSERVVMVIETNDPPPADPDEPPPRYYWKSITYDQYSGHGWFTGKTKALGYKPGEPIISEDEYEERLIAGTESPHRALQQEVRVVESIGGLLYTAGQLVTVDQDFSVAWRGANDPFGATLEATSYRAFSRLPVVGESQLREAGSAYPEWVRERYLTLPEELPNRVLTLARDLTATAPTPYDRAKAIESHLRRFPYTLDLPSPPANRDIVDYFLFDLQQGYCDYYATSMVVLARAAGLPARLAVGYINGTYDAQEARYVVSEAEAHSWVEIYFPGYGWVNFEPTGGRPAIERPSEAPPVVPPELENPLEFANAVEVEVQARSWLWLLILPAGLVLTGLALITWTVADGWRLRRLPPAETIARLYRRLYRQGQRLEAPLETGATPHEFAASLAGHVTGLSRERRWGSQIAPAVHELSWLTDLYVQTRYSPHRPAPADQLQAIQVWRRLQGRLWLVWVYVFRNQGVK